MRQIDLNNQCRICFKMHLTLLLEKA